MKIFDGCPGAIGIRRPTIKVKICPKCGEEMEIFSDEVKVNCSNCGFTIYNDLESCIQWCQYAKECVGEAAYEELMQLAKAKRKQR